MKNSRVNEDAMEVAMSSTINSLSSPFFLSLRSLFVCAIIISSFLQLSLSHQLHLIEEEEVDGEAQKGRRRLLGFKEKAVGSNSSFDCSPSGPCVSCQYSEKSDDKYRCSETGYRIPFKCVKVGGVTKEASDKGLQKSDSTQDESGNADNSEAKQRTLKDKSSGQKVEPQEYLTYRSCIQGVNEEKLSVLGFEVLILGLMLISGSFIFVRRKKNVAMAGAGNVRVQGNSRF